MVSVICLLILVLTVVQLFPGLLPIAKLRLHHPVISVFLVILVVGQSCRVQQDIGEVIGMDRYLLWVLEILYHLFVLIRTSQNWPFL